jgi:hypothetical protein
LVAGSQALLNLSADGTFSQHEDHARSEGRATGFSLAPGQAVKFDTLIFGQVDRGSFSSASLHGGRIK